jgi:hypothetical protein
MKSYVHLWYLVEFLLEWEMFHTNVAEKMKAYIYFFLIVNMYYAFVGKIK